jgi:hypothetical protein
MSKVSNRDIGAHVRRGDLQRDEVRYARENHQSSCYVSFIAMGPPFLLNGLRVMIPVLGLFISNFYQR